jgi:hypothetical protein
VNREEQVLRDEITLREASLQDAKRELEAGESGNEKNLHPQPQVKFD